MRSTSPIWTFSLAVTLAACGENTPPGDSANAVAGTPAAKVEAPIAKAHPGTASSSAAAPEARPAAIPAPRAAAPAPALPPRAAPYRALGTEPFWSVAVRGSTLILQRPDAPTRSFPTRLSGKGKAIRFAGEGITMAVTPGPCSDGMSDFIYADRVQVTLADGVLKGCGGQRLAPEE